MRPGPPRYEDASCKCGHGVPPVDRAGPYRGLCPKGKEIALEARRAKREARKESGHGGAPGRPPQDPNEQDIRALRQKPNLSKTILQLGKAGEKLEEAIDDRAAARVRARSALADFNEALKLVSHVARTLIEARVPDPRPETE